MHLPTTNPLSALTTNSSSLSPKTKAILAASLVTLIITAALYGFHLRFKALQAARRARLSQHTTDEKARLFLDQDDDVESAVIQDNTVSALTNHNDTLITMNAGIPPFAWQAGAGLLPNPESQTLPAYYPMGNGSGGFIPYGGAGGMSGMMPYNMGEAMGFGGGGGGGGMNPDVGQPKPQYLPPGPMPMGGFGGLGMGMGMGMMPYGGCGPMAQDMGWMGGMGMGGLPALHIPTVRLPSFSSSPIR